MNRQSEINAVDSDGWTMTISPASGWFDIHLGDLWRYRDLVLIFVRRDLVSIYKQTILGPTWFLLQPVLTSLVFTLIFGGLAKIPTDGVPPILFYLLMTTVWGYFSGCLVKTSSTFISNAHIFGKVYFPRLVVPLATVTSNLISFAIQMSLYLAVLFVYCSSGRIEIPLRPVLLLLPLLVVQMAILGLGCGIIVSSLTTRYRDLVHLVGFAVQLWMFVTPVIYPASMVSPGLKWLLVVNPMAPVLELFHYALHGAGGIDWFRQFVSVGMTLAILLVGLTLFSRVEKNFTDTV